MLTARARVYFKTREEGGHSRAFSGIQPSMEIDGELVACKILKGDVGSDIELGRSHDVTIELGYGEMFADRLKQGLEFRLMIASWEIGHGEIL